MATKTKNQLELTVVEDEEEKKNTQITDNDEKTASIPTVNNEESKIQTESEEITQPKCYCGTTMETTKFIQPTSNSMRLVPKCSGCWFQFNEKQTDKFYYHCPKGEVLPHKNGYNLCVICSKHIKNFKNDPIESIHDREKLYFIYNDNKMNGPLTQSEIITLFVAKRLKENELYVMSAAGDISWTKLDLSNMCYTKLDSKTYLYDLDSKDERRFTRIKKVETANAEFKGKYPELYAALVENYLSGRLNQIVFPDFLPDSEEKSSLSSCGVTIVGRFLAIAIMCILLLHCIPTGIVTALIVGLIWCIISRCIDIDDYLLQFALFIGTYLGMIVTPILTVYFVLTEADEWDEIQSWMIAYTVWGTSTFAVALCYLIFGVFLDQGYETIGKMINVCIGVDFGAFNVFNDVDEDDIGAQIAVIFVFPALASVLPAAICGFIANYVLEEKFELNCNADVTNTALCFQEEYGCCEIISSHDYRDSYAFIGGLASNIIATWAVIRVCGYLVVNAWDIFKVFAKRIK